MAQYAVLEGCAKTVSVGATPLALTDCLCFGNPEKPEEMWQFSQSCLAIREVCDNMRFNETKNLPIVAGNVSFYNQSGDRSIPASPMIGCFGKIKKKKVLKNGFQSLSSNLFLLGETPTFLGGSIVSDVLGVNNTKIEALDLKKYNNMLGCVLEASEKALLQSCSYVGLGGLATTVTKMSFLNNIGCVVEGLDKDCLFSENLSFVVEVSEKNSEAFEKILNNKNCSYKQIGKTIDSNKVAIENFIELDIIKAKKVWKSSLKERLQK